MRHFCTLCDACYLPRALVLYRSLLSIGIDFRLRVYVLDDPAAGVLEQLELPWITVIGLEQLERDDPELAATRSTRSWGEYCFTATPCVCRHSLLSDPGLSEITYLDADLRFFADPAPVFAEFDAAAVAIVPHRFSARWQHCTATHGRFNVGFNFFRNDEDGRAALGWWRQRCLEWCYLRFEPGRYGDQAYLDEFPRRFSRVHVVRDPGADLAPWNSEGTTITQTGDEIRVDGHPLIFYHFASLQLLRGRPARSISQLGQMLGTAIPALRNFRSAPGDESIIWRAFPGYRLSGDEVNLLWRPYVEMLLEATADVRRLDPMPGDDVEESRFVALARDSARGSVPGALRCLRARGRQRAGTE